MNVRRKRATDASVKQKATVDLERHWQAETKKSEVQRAKATQLINFVSGKVDDFWTKIAAAIAKVVDVEVKANEILQGVVNEINAVAEADKATIKDMQAKLV